MKNITKVTSKIANFAKIASLQGATFGIQFWYFASFAIFAIACMAIFAKITNFAKIAIFAKIASLQGATFGIQFKSSAAGDFSPVLPFSPLREIVDFG